MKPVLRYLCFVFLGTLLGLSAKMLGHRTGESAGVNDGVRKKNTPLERSAASHGNHRQGAPNRDPADRWGTPESELVYLPAAQHNKFMSYASGLVFQDGKAIVTPLMLLLLEIDEQQAAYIAERAEALFAEFLELEVSTVETVSNTEEGTVLRIPPYRTEAMARLREELPEFERRFGELHGEMAMQMLANEFSTRRNCIGEAEHLMRITPQGDTFTLAIETEGSAIISYIGAKSIPVRWQHLARYETPEADKKE